MNLTLIADPCPNFMNIAPINQAVKKVQQADKNKLPPGATWQHYDQFCNMLF
jgi:hypothetical protein